MNVQAKFTPGPWSNEALKIRAYGRGTIAVIPLPNTEGVFECQENARLIAAAPDLYKQLAAVRDILLACAEDATGTPSEQYFKDMAWDCDSVLAKARGEVE